jgi:hypothetical protein
MTNRCINRVLHHLTVETVKNPHGNYHADYSDSNR